MIGEQIEVVDPPVALFEHSQAALILDRMIAIDTEVPDWAVVISALPPNASDVNVPPPGETGQGGPGGDLARGFSWLIGRVGLSSYDVDAPAMPTNLGDVVPEGDGGSWPGALATGLRYVFAPWRP